MFDFGFWEMLMVVLVALVVVGPERLPGLARTVGFWVGKAKRMITEVKAEIHEELAAEELKKALDEQDLMEDVYEMIEETKKVGEDIKDKVGEAKDTATPSIEDDSTRQAEAGTEKT